MSKRRALPQNENGDSMDAVIQRRPDRKHRSDSSGFAFHHPWCLRYRTSIPLSADYAYERTTAQSMHE